jgi:hypothetical protein
MQRIVMVLVAAVVLGGAAVPALAEHELGHNDTGQVAAKRAEVLPSGYTDESQVYVWGRGWGSTFGLYGFITFCQNEGGYWYWGNNGYYYWNSC